jgi:serine/threonine protein kinase
MPDGSSERFVLLNHLADEFAARYRRGERPSLQEYVDRHPELADDIREFFPTLVEMEQVKDDRQAPVERPASHTLPALDRLGDFRIIREIGRGGMGVVYEAEQVSLGRRVALKVLPKQLPTDAKTKQRFEREARAAARLHHTNIVPVFGVGDHEGLPYYVMQFIRGLGLDEVLEELQRLNPGKPGSDSITGLTRGEPRIARKDVSAADVARSLMTGHLVAESDRANEAPAARGDVTAAHDPKAAADPAPPADPRSAGRLSDTFSLSSSSVVLPGAGRQSGRKRLTYWQSVARIGIQVADALEYAHRQGVLHRDTKPSNLLLDTTGTVWVTDFGLAKANDQQDLTHTGDILGTLRYMPPEAFDGKSDARSDVYALGLTLYELLAFRPAFDEKERNRLIKQVTTAEPARLDRLNPDVPRDLVTIVHKAIERDPGRRYASADELEADLKRFLDDEPIQARRQTQLERTWRWARHNPGIATLSGALAAVLVLVAVSSLLAAGYFNRLRENEAQAAQNEREARQAEALQRQIAEDKTKEAKAAGLVQLALNVDTPKVPPIIEKMTEYRQWTDPMLREVSEKSPQRLNASLALLPSDPGQVDYLLGRLLETDPRDVFPVIRDALAPHKDRLKDKLWTVLEKPELGKESQRLRAAAALAKYDPDDKRWANKPAEPAVFLSTLQEKNVRVEGSSFRKDGTTHGGIPVVVNGVPYPRSLFTHPPFNGSFASVSYDLDRPYSQFLAKVGIPALAADQQDPATPLVFEVIGNGKSIWKSTPFARRGDIQDCRISLAGINQLELRVNRAAFNNSWAWAVWLEPRLTCDQNVQDIVASDLVAVPANELTTWKDALRPVRLKLLAPLSVEFRSVNRPAEQTRATDILADYAADQPQLLADLLIDADDKQFTAIYPKLQEHGELGLPVLTGEIGKAPPPAVKTDWTVRFYKWDNAGKDKPVSQVLKVEGELTATDQLIQPGKRLKTFPFTMMAGRRYVIDMMTRENNPQRFDPFLYLLEPGGKVLAFDDDGGGSVNARITFTCRRTGTYTIFATTFEPNMTGKFLLSARELSTADAGRDRPPSDWLKSPILDELRLPRLHLVDARDAPSPPTPKVPPSYFAAVATTEVTLGDAEYTLTATADDGVRVWLDDELVIDDWRSSPRPCHSDRSLRQALQADPMLGDDRPAQHRYHAARAAALAATRQGKDEPPLDEAGKAKRRGQALDWLKAELTAWNTVFYSGPPQDRLALLQTLNAWRNDADLAGIRDAAALVKLPQDEQKAWQALWARVPELRSMVPNSREQGQTWRYTTQQPAEGWQKADFDAKEWKEGIAGFGTRDYASSVRTEWNTPDVWLPREFKVPEGTSDDLLLSNFHDDDAEVYINGVPALNEPGCNHLYTEMPLSAEARKALKPCRNVLAVHCKNTGGPGYIDVGIVAVKGNAGRLAYAQIAFDRKHYSFATQLWAAALASDPKVSDDRAAQHRARVALLAAAGQGQDEPQPDDAAKAKLRGQALNLLKAELAWLGKQLEKDRSGEHAVVEAALLEWQKDSSLAGIRDAAALAKLPADEQKAFTQLWADVAALSKKAAEQPK